MESDSRVALLVDNRQHIENDLDACAAVTVEGIAEQLEERRLQNVLSRYLRKHPYMEEFALSPSSRFYRIRVQSFSLVSRLHKVETLQFP